MRRSITPEHVAAALAYVDATMPDAPRPVGHVDSLKQIAKAMEVGDDETNPMRAMRILAAEVRQMQQGIAEVAEIGEAIERGDGCECPACGSMFPLQSIYHDQDCPAVKEWLAKMNEGEGSSGAAEPYERPKRVGCAACDRGDFQLGHHHECPVITARSLPTAKGKGAAEA